MLTKLKQELFEERYFLCLLLDVGVYYLLNDERLFICVGSALAKRLSYKGESYFSAFVGLLQAANLPAPLYTMHSQDITEMAPLNFCWKRLELLAS